MYINNQFNDEAITVNKNFPSLHSEFIEDNKIIIVGQIVLTDELGLCIDNYHVNIIASPDYPFRFPYVYETGGRIPINVDWHVFPNDGHCCIKAIPEEKLICKNGISLSYFINKELIPYFYNQKFREENGYFLNERSHGDRGNVEFFQEIFKTSDLLLIAKSLLFISKGVEPNRVSNCFCGSGKRYRKCHRDQYRLLSQFSRAELIDYTEQVISYLKNQSSIDN